MKKYIIITLALFSNLLSAQNRQVFEASSGEDISERVSEQIQYLFPDFVNGDVYLFGTPKVNGMLNYNMLVGEMQFLVNDKVFALSREPKALMVTIDNRKFYPFKRSEFTEELLSTGAHHLRVRRVGKAIPHSRRGAYGTWSSTASIQSYSSLNADNQVHSLNITERILVTVDSYYYIVGTNGKYKLIKNIKAFFKQFPGNNALIEAFVKENNIRLKNEDDLKALLAYCANLAN